MIMYVVIGETWEARVLDNQWMKLGVTGLRYSAAGVQQHATG